VTFCRRHVDPTQMRSIGSLHNEYSDLKNSSRINVHLACWSVECHDNSVHHVAAEDSLPAGKLDVQATRMFFSIEEGPKSVTKRGNFASFNTSDPTGTSLIEIEIELVEIAPRKRCGIGSRISDQIMNNDSWDSTGGTKFHGNHREWLSRIASIIAKRGRSYAVGFVLVANA